MYHRFSLAEETLKTSRQTFIKHLEYLTKHYKIISLADFADCLKNKKPLPPNAAVVTIDDGYEDAYRIAFPVLKKFNVPATLFTVTDFLDKKCWIWTDKARFILLNTKAATVDFEIDNKKISAEFNGKNSRLNAAGKINNLLKKIPDAEKNVQIKIFAEKMKVEIPANPPAEFAPIDWEQAREMDKSFVKIESHTTTHPILTKTDDDQLEFELAASRRKLEEILQRKMRIFCYPNGDCGERERKAVEAAGYECAVSTELRLCAANENIFALPRVDTDAEMRRFVQSTSGFDELKRRNILK